MQRNAKAHQKSVIKSGSFKHAIKKEERWDRQNSEENDAKNVRF